MSYQILISTTFQKQLERLDDQLKESVKDSLEELEEDPYKPRSGADIKKLSGTDPSELPPAEAGSFYAHPRFYLRIIHSSG